MLPLCVGSALGILLDAVLVAESLTPAEALDELALVEEEVVEDEWVELEVELF